MIIRQPNVVPHRAPLNPKKIPALPPAGSGMEVVVLVDGIYNNQNHNAVKAKAGDRIVVAAGPYGDSLVADGFVAEPHADLDQPGLTVAPPPPPTPPVTPGSDQTTLWTAAGINEELAAAILDAGYTTTAELLAAYDNDGLGVLTTIDGIGPKTAEKVIAWAAEQERNG